ncbi:MAG: nucleotidyl transferase AbiEii/AbiGii toxin family protein [Gammaproteobacteria bacterium]|nr:nucleotidyl transferase AbiEii/AbiGii toxin family protein [Gammaproteobacteria bacterium]
MTRKQLKNIAVSVRQRLLNLSRERGEDFQFILTRYALERFLYRLSVSNHRDRFLLKGAMLFALWMDSPHRATQDIDLLGFGEPDINGLVEIVKEICTLDVDDDGVVFSEDTVQGKDIRAEKAYWVLMQNMELDGDILARAIRATFERRGTPLSDSVPAPFTDKFAACKAKQWDAFLFKNKLPKRDFTKVLTELWDFLCPVLDTIKKE